MENELSDIEGNLATITEATEGYNMTVREEAEALRKQATVGDDSQRHCFVSLSNSPQAMHMVRVPFYKIFIERLSAVAPIRARAAVRLASLSA